MSEFAKPNLFHTAVSYRLHHQQRANNIYLICQKNLINNTKGISKIFELTRLASKERHELRQLQVEVQDLWVEVDDQEIWERWLWALWVGPSEQSWAWVSIPCRRELHIKTCPEQLVQLDSMETFCFFSFSYLISVIYRVIFRIIKSTKSQSHCTNFHSDAFFLRGPSELRMVCAASFIVRFSYPTFVISFLFQLSILMNSHQNSMHSTTIHHTTTITINTSHTSTTTKKTCTNQRRTNK